MSYYCDRYNCGKDNISDKEENKKGYEEDYKDKEEHKDDNKDNNKSSCNSKSSCALKAILELLGSLDPQDLRALKDLIDRLLCCHSK